MPDKKFTYPPGAPGAQGQSVTVHEDGSVTVKDPDGREIHYDPRTGNKTATPPVPPDVEPPGLREVRPDGEIRIRYGSRKVRFYPGPPPRFKIIRDGAAEPHEEEFNLKSGKRGVIQKDGDPKVETPASTAEDVPSTHPLPAGTPTPTQPKPSSSGNKSSKKGKASRRKGTAKRKPARTSKRPTAKRKKSRR